jgi:hypothetical protein
LFGSDVQRYISEDRVGSIAAFGLRLYVDNPQTHTQLHGFEYEEFNNQVSASTGLVLPKQRFAYGFCLKVNEHCGFKVAGTQEKYLNDDPFSAFGIYPKYENNWGGIELGYENDQKNTRVSFAQGKIKKFGTIYLAASLEDFEEGHAVIINQRHARLGGAYLGTIPKTPFRLFGGGNYNLDLEKPTWIAGISCVADVRSNGLNPAFTVIHRNKPDAKYTLGMLTLWGRTLNEDVTAAIDEAFLQGSMKRSRVIGGKYMGEPGLSNAHEMQDFGKVSIAYSSLDLKAGTEATLISQEVSGYLTCPRNFGRLANPYLGITWTKFTDLIYDPVIHRLNDPAQEYWEFKTGVKVRFRTIEDSRHRNQLGYCRLSLAVDTNGGYRLKSSLWF